MKTTYEVTYHNPPARCDVCSKPINDTFFDAKTQQGPWANMCTPCYMKHGIKLGTGYGQKYEKQTNGSFVKTAG